MRYTVTLRIDVKADSISQAHARIQKLADTINTKDPNNKAWIPKIKENKEGN